MEFRSASVAGSARRWRSLAAYVLLGVTWFGVAKFALSVRVPTVLWTPVFKWALLQRLLLVQELKYEGLELQGLWALLYVMLAVLLWLGVEIAGRWRSGHYLRRGIVTWGLVQVGIWAVLEYLI